MIQLERVSKRFGEIAALSEVELLAQKGEAVLLTGPSGAGKSTLLRLLYAAERPDGGRVLIHGRDIGKLQRSAIPYLRRNIGVVFQDFKLLRDRTARDNVALAIEVLEVSPEEAARRALVALEAVGLAARANLPVAHLSGGEQQRVAVARAIVGSPDIVVADEPTGNLDPERALDLLELFDVQRDRGVTLIIATHDPLVMTFGESRGWRRVRLEGGRLIQSPLVVIEGEQTDRSARDAEKTDRREATQLAWGTR